jgi:hypothetical protein
MDGASFYTYCLEILKRTDKSSEFYEAVTDTVMDMRLRFNSEDYKTISSELSITTIGNYTLDLPSDFGRLTGDPMVRDDDADQDYTTLNKISIQTYNQLYSDRYNDTVGNRNTGTPVHYCVYGGDILVGPPVDKDSYTFRVPYAQESATAITSGTSDVPFTSRYRKTVRYGVLKELYLMLENFQEAEVWSNLYEADIQKIINNDMANVRDDEPMQYNGV